MNPEFSIPVRGSSVNGTRPTANRDLSAHDPRLSTPSVISLGDNVVRPSPVRSAESSSPQRDRRSSHSPSIAEVEDRLIVGVDFGTTYSGVAAVYSATPEDVDIIKTWPGGNGITSDKVPTEITYTDVLSSEADLPTTDPDASATTPKSHRRASTTTTTTSSEHMKWGFSIPPNTPRLKCIKLFLDRAQHLPSFVSPLDTASLLRSSGRTVIDAVSDYLSLLYEHTMDTLARRYGQSFLRMTKVEFVLTVPAVWSDYAKNATLQAAERAGMGSRHTLRLISEPEAAAVYTLKAIQPNHLCVGDNFVVCDAGGGTVDLIAYRITQLNPLRVEESAVGTGGVCGSAVLNYAFEDHVRERLGAERLRELQEKKPKSWNMALRYFEDYVKRNFSADLDPSHEFNVPFPGLPDDEEVGLDSGFLTLTPAQVGAIFEPVITEVIKLVQGQVSAIRARDGAVVSGIVLVGGFGQSNYLYQRLKAHFNEPSASPPPYTERPTHEAGKHGDLKPVEVMQPLYAWTAVVRGAVLRGLEGSMVVTRQSRLHYGTSYATVFDEGKHSPADRYWSPLWERWMVSDRMQWHIAKGTPISPDTPISFHYTRNFRPGQSLVVEDDLIACTMDEAPDAYGPDLISVCTLTTDLNAVPRSLFTRLTTTKGVEFDNLDFTLEMRIESAGLVFELKVDGVRYGKVEAEFH